MSELDTVMDEIINLFQKYARLEGNEHSLSLSEAKTLIKAEFLEKSQAKDVQKIKEHLDLLDGDSNGEVSFFEFMRVVSICTVFMNCHLMG